MGFSYSTDKKQRGSGYDFTDTENTKFTFGGLSKSIDEISAKIQQEKGNVENVVQQVDDNSSPKVLDVDNVFQKASKGWDKQKVSNKRAKHTTEGKQKKTLGFLKIMGFFSKKGVKNVTVQKHDAEYTDKLKCSDTKMDSHRPSKKIKTKNKITKKDCTDREEKTLVSGVTMEDSKQDDSESLIKNVTAIEKTQEHHQEYTATRESTDTSENTLIMKTPSLEVGIKIKELDFGSYDLEDFQKYPAPPVTAKINILKEPEKVDKEDESVCGEDAFPECQHKYWVYKIGARQANIDTIERAIAQFEDVNPAMARRTSKFLALYREMSKLETIYEIDEEELATFEVFK
ncbi:hypothetical protein AX774_g1625 [Zancudomyces culisetae]|uniref:Uncharacterized protein n=1 Tax=Zancudomyces culisetae TaxID=1213189 RepID=A0A1R1PV52_ZANCU|nr:hypothetical protein AX774_g1625 [Zancudomyces culisetae]|eukprot:OMH84846.1 hypothetical protein AX774_g1625 [Zancudomyces culisetae]